MTESQQSLTNKLSISVEDILRAAWHTARQPQPSGEWPLSTILIHLWLVEEVIWQARLNQMVQQENPHWVWTEPNLNEAVAKLGDHPLTELAQNFASRRLQTLNYLQSLSEDGWARIGTHATSGEMDVAGLCERILEHDEEHLTELRKRTQ